MNLEGLRIGIIAEYCMEADPRLTDPSTDVLARHLVISGAEVVAAPWQAFSQGRDGCFDLTASRKDSQQLSEHRLDVLYVRDLGELEDLKVEFVRFLDHLAGLTIPVMNSVDTMRRNLGKEYLIDFAGAGLPVAELTIVSDARELKTWRSGPASHFPDIVLKPLDFGELGKGVCRYEESTPAEIEELFSGGRRLIAQEFMPEIADGEKRLVFVGDRFSHAVIKPISDGFKATPDGGPRPYTPDLIELAIARRAMDVWPERIDVMRIDLAGSGSRCRIVELELVNPNLAEHCIASDHFPRMFANHICERVTAKGRL